MGGGDLQHNHARVCKQNHDSDARADAILARLPCAVITLVPLPVVGVIDRTIYKLNFMSPGDCSPVE
jgi:hypothetical protein